MTRFPLHLPSCCLAASLASLLAVGCGSSAIFPALLATTGSTAGAAIQGHVHGGQDPISGAHIYLMAADQSTYGQPADDLLLFADTALSDSIGPYVKSGSDGSFSISNDYTCNPGQVVYLLATQGNPGVGAGNNAAIALMAVLGPCPSAGVFSSGLSINIDELTTVAGGFALSGYMTDATHLSYPPSAAVGIANAAAVAGYMADISAGAALTQTPNKLGIVPQAEIDTLGNILAYCVNSDGTTNCNSLFGYTRYGSDPTPTDTIQALLTITHHPAINTQNLFNLVGAAGDPFQPSLSAAPNDFSIELFYTSASAKDLAYSQSKMAVDANGDLWIPHSSGSQEIGPDGSLITTNAGLQGYYAAVSPSDGSVWIAGQGIYSSGYTINDSATDYSNQEVSVAFDSTGNAWTGNQGPPSIGEFTGASADITTAYTGGGLSQTGAGIEGNGIAVDSQGDVWALWRDHNVAAEVASNGAAITPSTGAADSSIQSPAAIAIDSSDRAWIIEGSAQLTVLNSSGGSVSPNGVGWPLYNNLYDAQDIAIDGAGLAWVTSGDDLCIYSIDSTGNITSPDNGYSAVASQYPTLLAIDPSGNVWVADGDTAGLGEFIGLATPVHTPLTPGHLGSRP